MNFASTSNLVVNSVAKVAEFKSGGKKSAMDRESCKIQGWIIQSPISFQRAIWDDVGASKAPPGLDLVCTLKYISKMRDYISVFFLIPGS